MIMKDDLTLAIGLLGILFSLLIVIFSKMLDKINPSLGVLSLYLIVVFAGCCIMIARLQSLLANKKDEKKRK